MKTCKSVRDLFEEYLFNELNNEETEKMDKHMKECDKCRSLFDEERALQRLTKKVKRPEPAPEFWDEYWVRLKDRMEREDILKKEIPETEKREFQLIQWIPRWVFQGAAALILITIGLVMGKVIFSPSSNPIQNGMVQNNSSDLSQNAALVKNTRDYIDQSRVMLLGVMNYDSRTEDPSALNLSYQQKVSRELVTRAGFIKNELDESRQRRLYELIEDLEVILMQIANLDADPNGSEIRMIQDGVSSRGILFKIRMSEMRQSMNNKKIKSEKI